MDPRIEAFVMPYNFKPRADELSAIEKLRWSLANHVEQESKFLAIYGEAIENHNSPLVKFILRLVLADEETHHNVLSRVVANLDADLTWRQDGEHLPKLGDIDKAEKKRLRDLTDEFIAEEKHGIAQTKALMKESKGCYSDLLTLLLRTIIHDSEKHLMMLKFIRKQLK